MGVIYIDWITFTSVKAPLMLNDTVYAGVTAAHAAFQLSH